MQQFRIPITMANNKQNSQGALNVFKALFDRGYVFDSVKRHKTIDAVAGWFDDYGWDYDWILVGYDGECKMVLVVCTNNYGGKYSFPRIELDKFLQMVDNKEI